MCRSSIPVKHDRPHLSLPRNKSIVWAAAAVVEALNTCIGNPITLLYLLLLLFLFFVRWCQHKGQESNSIFWQVIERVVVISVEAPVMWPECSLPSVYLTLKHSNSPHSFAYNNTRTTAANGTGVVLTFIFYSTEANRGFVLWIIVLNALYLFKGYFYN